MAAVVPALVPHNAANVKTGGKVLHVKSKTVLTNVAVMVIAHQVRMENVIVNQVGMVPTVVVATNV